MLAGLDCDALKAIMPSWWLIIFSNSLITRSKNRVLRYLIILVDMQIAETDKDDDKKKDDKKDDKKAEVPIKARGLIIDDDDDEV